MVPDPNTDPAGGGEGKNAIKVKLKKKFYKHFRLNSFSLRGSYEFSLLSHRFKEFFLSKIISKFAQVAQAHICLLSAPSSL